MRPRVAAIVLNYDGFEDTVQCIQSLQRTGYPDLGIVIVDNASPDGSGQKLKEQFPQHTVLLESINHGYSGGNNVGIRYALAARIQFVVILNNDVVVDPNSLSLMIDKMIQDESVGVVTCRVMYKDDPEKLFAGAGRISTLLCTGINTGSHIELFQNSDQDRSVDFACGVLMLVRAKIFETVGLLDERFFMYFEDVEFSRRVSAHFKIAYCSRAKAFHKSGGGTSWGNYTELYLYYHTRNRFLAYGSSPLYYKMYVALFSIFITMMKSIVISSKLFLSGSTDIRPKLMSLWRGLRDGIALNFHSVPRVK